MYSAVTSSPLSATDVTFPSPRIAPTTPSSLSDGTFSVSVAWSVPVWEACTHPAVPAATAEGTGWPPRPDGPTPGDTGAWPGSAAGAAEPAADFDGTDPPAAICASDDSAGPA